jgi:hypothetical protein
MCAIMFIIFCFRMTLFIISFHQSFSTNGQLKMILKIEVWLSLDFIFIVWIEVSFLLLMNKNVTIKYRILKLKSAILDVLIWNEVFLGAILPWWSSPEGSASSNASI